MIFNFLIAGISLLSTLTMSTHALETVTTTASADTKVERFFPCAECPPPYPNEHYTPPDRRQASATTSASDTSALQAIICPAGARPLNAMDTDNNWPYQICCANSPFGVTYYTPDRGLQCCADQYSQDCKHDPVDASQCTTGYYLIKDAINHVEVCKSGTGPTSQSVSISTVPASTTVTIGSTAMTSTVPSPTTITTASPTRTPTTSSTATIMTATKTGNAVKCAVLHMMGRPGPLFVLDLALGFLFF